jgi:hypothetical protein
VRQKEIGLRSGVRGWVVMSVLLLGSSGALAQANLHTDPLNFDPLVKQAFADFYNLDFDGALKVNEEVARQHPNDPMAWNYMLTTIVFRELYHQDLLDTTYYAHDSFLTTKRDIDVAPATRSRIDDLTSKVIAMTDAELKANPKDANAYFAWWTTRSRRQRARDMQHATIPSRRSRSTPVMRTRRWPSGSSSSRWRACPAG